MKKKQLAHAKAQWENISKTLFDRSQAKKQTAESSAPDRSFHINERETWLRDMADTLPVMLWVAGTDKLCTFFNKAWIDYTGRDMEEDIGNGWLQGVHPNDREQCLQVFIDNFDKRQPFQAEYRFRRFDAHYHWVICNGKPTFSTEGRFNGYIGSVTDIHHQKMFAEELEQRVQQRTSDLLEANENLMRSNSELEQFAYVASHDLQEPLRKIITFSDRIQQRYEKDIPENAVKYIEKITVSAQYMRKLINDLLNFSRVSKTGEQFTLTDLNGILEGVLKNFDLIIQRKNVKITSEGLPTILAVPVQMTQLFHNLISNAIKFSSRVTVPEVNITCSLVDTHETNQYPQLKKDEQYCKISIRDNGIGFDPQFAEQIFIIFNRLNEKQNYPGTGIGLALCRKIVAYHKGFIYAESNEMDGAVFHLLLPMKK